MPPSEQGRARRLLDDCFLHDKDRMRHHEALDLLKNRLAPLADSETLPLDQAAGRILAENVLSRRNVPPADNSAVDGYAFAHADYLAKEGHLPVTARIAAGDAPAGPLEAGSAVRIFTGATMPDGADTVAMQEDCRIQDDGGAVTIPPGLKPGANRRKAGEDLRQGDTIATAATLLTPQHIASIASAGFGEIPVFGRLRIALVSGGNELVEPGNPARDGQIYDTNRHMLKALLAGMPVEVSDLGILPDDPAIIGKTLSGAAQGHHAIISSGGTSRGEEDHIVATLDGIGKRHLWQLAVKPGRPMSFGQIDDCVFFGLPGNPVACMVCFLLYIRPALLRLGGADWQEPMRFPLPAGFDIAKKKSGRREFWRGKVVPDDKGKPRLEKFARDGSGLISGLWQSGGLIEVGEDVTAVSQGDLLDFIPWSEFGI